MDDKAGTQFVRPGWHYRANQAGRPIKSSVLTALPDLLAFRRIEAALLLQLLLRALQCGLPLHPERQLHSGLPLQTRLSLRGRLLAWSRLPLHSGLPLWAGLSLQPVVAAARVAAAETAAVASQARRCERR